MEALDKMEGFEGHFEYIEIPEKCILMFFDGWWSQSSRCCVQIDPYGILEPPGAPEAF